MLVLSLGNYAVLEELDERVLHHSRVCLVAHCEFRHMRRFRFKLLRAYNATAVSKNVSESVCVCVLEKGREAAPLEQCSSALNSV